VLSITIPIYNEVENILILYEGLITELVKIDRPFEIILVNDGSTDGSEIILGDLSKKDVRVKVVNFSRNFGQTAAMMAGIDYATGDIIIPMDGDLQNDPADIVKLIEKLDEGYDVVSGWRKNRQDSSLRRNLPSRIANWIISRVSGVHLHDYGCSLKAYKRDAIKNVKLYGEMHRFIPIYASWYGAKVIEIPVNHHARKFGVSKYGLERVLKVVLDLMVVTFLDRYARKPIYVFGGFGFLSLIISIFFGIWAIYLKFIEHISFIQTPLPLLTVVTALTSVMCVLMGLLAEISTRTWHESQDKSIYHVRATFNIDSLGGGKSPVIHRIN
jgi:glycosyltransferase involved in cell wall biosynthesis